MFWLVVFLIVATVGLIAWAVDACFDQFYTKRTAFIRKHYPLTAAKYLAGSSVNRSFLRATPKSSFADIEAELVQVDNINRHYADLERDYPLGVKAYMEFNPKASKSDVLDDKQKVRDYEKYTAIARYNKSLIDQQKSFSFKALNHKKEIAPDWGHYFYDLQLRSVDRKGGSKNVNYRIWDLFYASTCLEDDLDYTYFPNVKANQAWRNDLLAMKLRVRSSWAEQAEKLITALRDELQAEASDARGSKAADDLVVLLADSAAGPDFVNFHMMELQLDLVIDGITCDSLGNAQKYLHTGHSTCIVVLDVVNHQERLLNESLELLDPILTKVRTVRDSRGLPSEMLHIVYISYLKEYSRDEMKDLIEQESANHRPSSDRPDGQLDHLF